MKSIFKIVFVTVFVSIIGYNICTTQKKDILSDLTLVNVEALANAESTNECQYCSLSVLAYCRDWGWGGCLGYPLAYEV